MSEQNTQGKIVLEPQDALNAAKVIEYALNKGLPGGSASLKQVIRAFDLIMHQLQPLLETEAKHKSKAKAEADTTEPDRNEVPSNVVPFNKL